MRGLMNVVFEIWCDFTKVQIPRVADSSSEY